MKLYDIVFSPTGGTQKVAALLTDALEGEVTRVDLTDSKQDFNAVAEHSIARQFAAGRPDTQDAQQLSAFAQQIQDKLSAGNPTEPAITGNRPYKKAGGAGMVPKPTKECTSCGVCAKQCPVQAIDPNNPKKVDEKSCISCMRCISVCPQSARKVSPIMLGAASLMLKKVCSERKENELFL